MLSCVVVLAALAAVQAAPTSPIFPQFGFQQPSSATGQSSSNINSGQSVDPFGNVNTIKQHQSLTGGQTQGFGATNVGNAFTTEQRQQGFLGNAQNANVGSNSQQFTGGLGFPSFPGFPVPQAQGQAGATFTEGETIGVGGQRNKITSLSSQAGGSGSGGGSSTSSAHGSTSSTDGIFGSNSQSNTGAQSVQTSGR